MIVCDTGPLVAAALSNDTHHHASVELFSGMHLASVIRRLRRRMHTGPGRRALSISARPEKRNHSAEQQYDEDRADHPKIGKVADRQRRDHFESFASAP